MSRKWRVITVVSGGTGVYEGACVGSGVQLFEESVSLVTECIDDVLELMWSGNG